MSQVVSRARDCRMECNRDEALEAKEIAEKKFAAKDVIGAKKFAIMAQNLNPDLKGIDQMIATLDVHLSGEVMIHGEKDWYAILSVEASADDETVKKQYRKLALMLHPDKNNSIGAESAFKLISEAWNVLSDKTRRLMYDKKWKTQAYRQKFSQSCGFSHFSENAASSFKNRRNADRRSNAAPAKMPSSASSMKAFWTPCTHCKMKYEFQRIYLNKSIVCPNCRESFLASEIPNPTVRSKSSEHCATQNSCHTRDEHGRRNGVTSCGPGSMNFQNLFNLDYFDRSNFQWGAFSSRTGAASAAASPSTAAQAARMVHEAYDKVKRERELSRAAAKRGETSERKTAASTGSDAEHHRHSSEDPPAKKRLSVREDPINSNEKAGNGWEGGGKQV